MTDKRSAVIKNFDDFSLQYSGDWSRILHLLRMRPALVAAVGRLMAL
jgi:hypothetical protein